MKPMPSADENRRLAEVQTEKAAKLPTGSTKESHLKKARDYETSAHSDDWAERSPSSARLMNNRGTD